MSEEKDNVHPVVRLLVARMESHPEEFDLHERLDAPVYGTHRWEDILNRVNRWATEEEINLLSRPFMDAAHRDALDELMNGPERRAEEERIRQEEHRRWMKGANQTQLAGVVGAQQYQNALSSSAYAAQLQQAYAQAGLKVEHDIANRQYRISNGTIGEVVDEEEIRGPGVLERVLNRLIK